MKTHEKLINMLENGGDEQEFNNRLWCWLRCVDMGEGVGNWKICPNYLQSLDACKVVMDEYLDGWCPNITPYFNNYDDFSDVDYSVTLAAHYKNSCVSPSLKNINHAWLHAMIQAIAYERGKA